MLMKTVKNSIKFELRKGERLSVKALHVHVGGDWARIFMTRGVNRTNDFLKLCEIRNKKEACFTKCATLTAPSMVSRSLLSSIISRLSIT